MIETFREIKEWMEIEDTILKSLSRQDNLGCLVGQALKDKGDPIKDALIKEAKEYRAGLLIITNFIIAEKFEKVRGKGIALVGGQMQKIGKEGKFADITPLITGLNKEKKDE